MAIRTIQQLIDKFGPGDFPRSADYVDLIETLADDRNAVYFSDTEPEDTSANPVWFDESTSDLKLFFEGSWIVLTLPSQDGASGKYLKTDGTSTSWSDVVAEVTSAIVDSAPGTLDTLNELAAALGDDENFATTVTDSLAEKAPIESPSFTGTVVLPSTTSVGDISSTELSYLDGVSSSIQDQLDEKVSLTAEVFPKTSNYTLVVADRGNLITCDGTLSITIPPSIFAGGDRVDFINSGTGIVSFVSGSGVTINSVNGATTIDTRWAGATLFFTSPNAGVLIGKLA
jgi:hypothetical protein